jgi:hypothetical protein
MYHLSTALFLASLMTGPLALVADTLPINELIAKAGLGDTRAQVSLAVRYRDGDGVKLAPDDDGSEKATAFLRSELDAGRPVVVDFKYIGPDYPGGDAGHTLGIDTP